MKCEVIRDLIPLCIDGCRSEESERLVKEHLALCGLCRACMENASKPMMQTEAVPPKPRKLGRVSLWKASALQSVLFFLYFAVITAGVTMEAYTPAGIGNGVWAFGMVVPATGALLGLVNWYFVRLYRSRRAFVIWSLAAAIFATLCCFVWATAHYQILPGELLSVVFGWNVGGSIFTVVNFLLAAVLSDLYARMLGKE